MVYGWDDLTEDGMFVDQSDEEWKKDEFEDPLSFEEIVEDDTINDEE